MRNVTYSTSIENQRYWPDGSLELEVAAGSLIELIQGLHTQGYTHLSTIIGLENDDKLVLLYPLSKLEYKQGCCLFVKLIVSKELPIVPSVCMIFPAADVYERELREMLGIDFGIQYKSLLLPDNFPTDIYPLRKEYKSSDIRFEMDKRNIGFASPNPLEDKGRYTISVGPQHPTHKEPIRFQFYIKGETIEEVELRLGYNHRGIEKALEEGDWIKNLYLIERICGICSAAHQIAYCVAAERLAKLSEEVPLRAQWIRTLIAELERVHSHMLWYGVLAHDAGYDMMFHISWRDREDVMDILEQLTGNRVNYSMMTLGGVRRDIENDLRLKTLRKLKTLQTQVKEHVEVMREEITFRKRLEGIGSLNLQDVAKMNAVGPTARGSGLNFDLRRDVPYLAYDEMPIEVYTELGGDVYSSLLVRLNETLNSLDICEYILENLPKGELTIKVPNRLPEGDAHCRVEAPRGEDYHYLKSSGGKSPDRHKIRAPTLANISSLLYRFRNMQVADIPVIIRLIDPCIGCMERVTFVDTTSNDIKTISGNELKKLARRRHKNGTPIRLFR